jgi:chromate reductase, NAD(P)H dehydrogenase (quinone)
MRDLETTPKTVLAIPGSLRRRSYNRSLLEAAVEISPAGLQLRLYEDLATIPMFDEDLEHETHGGPAAVQRLRSEVASADALLFSTPEYNQSIPGVLKNAIDWLSRPAPEEVLVGKPVALIGATPGRWGTRFAQAHLRHVLGATGSVVLPSPVLFIRDAATLFDGDGRLSDGPTRTALRGLLEAFSRWVALVDGGTRVA